MIHCLDYKLCYKTENSLNRRSKFGPRESENLSRDMKNQKNCRI